MNEKRGNVVHIDNYRKQVGECDLLLEREFDAPRKLVFRMFTEAEHVSKWWAPQPYTIPVCTIDLRPGGKWHYAMQSPEGVKHWALAIYREIDSPKKLVYTSTFSDEFANPVGGIPEMHATIAFDEAADGRTTFRGHFEFESAEALRQTIEMGFVEGITMTLEHLATLLAQEGSE